MVAEKEASSGDGEIGGRGKGKWIERGEFGGVVIVGEEGERGESV